MKRLFSSSFTLGILGGGQLGKMLLYETRKWDIRTRVLDPSPDAPCAIAANYFEVGSLMDYNTVLEFGRKVDVLTIEIEHVNTDALKQLVKEGITVHPNPEMLELIKDKGRQKIFYRAHGLPTAPFQLFAGKDELLGAELHFPCVWKSTTGGYDGKGVMVLRNADDIKNLPDQPCLIEHMADFTHEIAVVVARNENGEMVHYPVVEMEFHPVANLVEYVICPARLPMDIQKKAIEIADKTAEAFGICGLLAVEMFLMPNGEIWVNEVAPRTHNSGHLTIEGNTTNQFEQHIRAVLNLPLGSTEIKCPAVMVNLTGEDGHTGPVVYEGMEDLLGMSGVTPHIYGKSETRPFRKMGHVTIVDSSAEEARAKAEKAKDIIRVISNA